MRPTSPRLCDRLWVEGQSEAETKTSLRNLENQMGERPAWARNQKNIGETKQTTETNEKPKKKQENLHQNQINQKTICFQTMGGMQASGG